MQTREDLEKRVADLERQVSAMRVRQGMWTVRRRSAETLAGLALYDIAFGPDSAKGEMRGHARGILAIGDIATGVIAIGGFARGIFALGGLAAGLVTLGGFSAGLVAVGGLALGGVAMGGGAIGAVAIGGAAAGSYACGGAALGGHVVSGSGADPEAVRFFREHVLPCPAPARRRYG